MLFSLVKMFFWSLIALSALSHFVVHGHFAGLVIFVILVPIIFVRMVVTLGRGMFGIVKGLAKVF